MPYMRDTNPAIGPRDATRTALSVAAQVRLDAERGVIAKCGVSLELRHEAGAVLRPHVIGICRSDAKEAAGRRLGPSQFGHELVAEIVDCWGAEVLRIGDTVCLDPNVVLNRTSGFAELFMLDAPADRLEAALYKVSSTCTSLENYVLAEPIACAEHCARIATSAVHATPRSAVVIGAGTMGLFIAHALRRRGIPVTLLNRSKARLRFVATFSLEGITLGSLAEPPSADLVVLATTFVSHELLEKGFMIAADQGRVVVFGGIDKAFGNFRGVDVRSLRLSESHRWLTCGSGKQVEIVGSYGLASEDFLSALRLIGSGDISQSLLDELITGRHLLSELPSLLDAMNSGDDLGKRLIFPTSPRESGILR
ncbi:MAG: hypothetical protein CBARDCOR_4926 [uncultured Caballeronia sp.]|nr:MAG: hypothetical protein CBARDCOR_4926 [uncultured Caballeronia sp.]